MNDAIIVGAGPAGLYTALLMAQEGFEITVLEEHPAVGVPVHCTGLVSGELDQLYKIPPHIVLHRPSVCHVVSPGGVRAEFKNPGEDIAVLDRAGLDVALAAHAREAGATILTGRRVSTIALDNGHVNVSTEDGECLRGRAVVIAAGVAYRFHGLIGARSPAVLHSAQLELDADPADTLEVHLGRTVAPEGFAWLVPLRRGERSRMKAGVLLRGDARAHLRAFLARPEIAARLREEPGEPVRRLLPVSPVRRSYGERMLAVGDAAGLTKPVTGGGIFYSLLSASIGAQVLVDALHQDDLRAERLAAYEALWRARLGRELRTGMWFRRLLANLTDGELDRFVQAAASDTVQSLIARTARFNWHRAVILAVLRQPGIKSTLLRSLFRWS